MRRSENAALPKGGKPHPKRVENQGIVAESRIFKSKGLLKVRLSPLAPINNIKLHPENPHGS
jgi:hypothetical protein